MVYQIIRPIQQVAVGAVTKPQIFRVPSGPRGINAGQDIAFGPLTGGFTDGEIIDAPELGHPATYNQWALRTKSALAAPVVVGLLQNGTEVATATLAASATPQRVVVTVQLRGAEADVFSLAMPSPQNPQLLDLTSVLRSLP